jgi:hypothetical protein
MGRGSNSGSFSLAMLAAMRLASSRVIKSAARRGRSSGITGEACPMKRGGGRLNRTPVIRLLLVV